MRLSRQEMRVQSQNGSLSFPMKRLEDVVEKFIDYRGKTPTKTSSGVPLVTAKVIKAGRILPPDEFIAADSYDSWMTRGLPKRGDVLFTTEAPLGEVAQVEDPHVALAQRVLLIRGNSKLLDNTYLRWALTAGVVCDQILRRSTGSTVRGIRQKEFRKVNIPLPPLSEQKRIAGILDQADGLRRKRQQALALTDQFLRSTFLDLFGDPVTNPKQLRCERLGDCVSFSSGGTPSKARKDYWIGEFPWVSPKDMKRVIIDDAEDHVAPIVFEETNLRKLPPRTVLIVVRGMILAHTMPIAISACPLAINQDMRAMLPTDSVVPEFLLWNLKVSDQFILSRVATAAHGTKRLEMSEVADFPVLLPPDSEQRKFSEIVARFGAARERLKQGKEQHDDLFNALVQQAFRGEL